MRNAASHLLPGGGLLRAEHFRKIVDHQDEAVLARRGPRALTVTAACSTVRRPPFSISRNYAHAQ